MVLSPQNQYHTLSVFVSLFKSNIFNHRYVIVTNQWHPDNRCPCTNTRQSTPLTGKMCYLLVRRPRRKEDTNVERVGYGQGRAGMRRSPRFRPLSCRRRHDVAPNQVILNFEGDGGMSTMNPYGDMFCRTFGRLFDVSS